MQKIIAILVLLGILVPGFALADTVNDPTLGQLLSRLAAVESLQKGLSIGCTTVVTKPVVHVGEKFTLAWGSYGADPSYSTDPQNSYAINGQQEMMLESVQTRVYHMTFFGPQGSKVTCDQTVTVVS